MIVGSIKEDLSLEKRVSITPETAKNIINLGLKICIEKDYATHLGIKDSEYKGWIIVEAEQDPKIANPLNYAVLSKKYLDDIWSN